MNEPSTVALETARDNMIEQQVRPWNVLDTGILETLDQVPREHFVPAEYRSLAFADFNVPLPCGQVMMQPKVEARLLQALNLTGQERCLEVGTGSGHFAALLGRRAGRVLSIEINPELSGYARERLAALGLGNVRVMDGDGLDTSNLGGEFDAIALSGAVAAVPDELLAHLGRGGRMTAVTGAGRLQEAVLITRGRGDTSRVESLFETELPYLEGAEPRPVFTF